MTLLGHKQISDSDGENESAELEQKVRICWEAFYVQVRKHRSEKEFDFSSLEEQKALDQAVRRYTDSQGIDATRKLIGKLFVEHINSAPGSIYREI